jgi:hypothetical protein
MEITHSVKTEEEVQMASVSAHENDLHFHLMMAELVDQLQDATPIERQTASLRKMVSRFGDAYFFYNQTGEFCLLTDFLQEVK